MTTNGKSSVWIALFVVFVIAAGAFFWRGAGESENKGTRLEPGAIDFATVGFEPNAITLARGVHLLGKVVPGSAYAIETSDGLILVDCGIRDDADFVIRQLKELNLDVDTLKKVFISHIHADHCQGAAYLRERTGAKIYAGAGDAPLLAAGTDEDAFFSKYTMAGLKLHPTTVDVALNGGESIALGDTIVTTIATPGHTPGSMCYRLERDGRTILFTGDTISSLTAELGTYITKLPPRFRGNATDYLASLATIKTLPAPDVVLPGHTEDDPVGQSPWIRQAVWNQLLDRGAGELEEIIAHYATDGPDFLGKEPFQIMDGLFYLGPFRDHGMYACQVNDTLVLFDAPSGRGFVEFLTEGFGKLNLELPENRFVLLTSCDARNTANLGELVSRWQFQVVAPTDGLDELKKRCPENTKFVTVDRLPLTGFPPIVPHRLGGIGDFPVAYEIELSDKRVLVSGRVPVEPVERTINQLHRDLIQNRGDLTELLQSLRRLSELSPDLWLPVTIVNDQNANVYGSQWRDVVQKNYQLFETIAK